MINDILWLVAARSGSKSIPDKNIKLLGEIPLLAYRIKSAISISPNENVWISTDSEQYAEIGKQHGAVVPFIRPIELASDTASSVDVVLHAINEAEKKGLHFKALGLLEPTSPFITFGQLQNACELLLLNEEADSIVAVKETRPNSFFIQQESMYLSELAERLSKIKFQGRQSFKKEITPSGGFYIVKWDNFKIKKAFYTPKTMSYLVNVENELEIDEPIDWKFAEFILQSGMIQTSDLFKI